MFVRMVNSCLIINMKQISLFYAENVLKMRKMRKSANYADPHHRILSDALSRAVAVTGFVQKIATVFPGLFKDFSRTKLNFQGLPTMNVISQIVYKMHIPSPS